MSRHQRGHIFERHGAFHVRFYQSKMHNGIATRVQKSHKLCDKDRVRHSRSSKPVRFAAEEFMRKVNSTSIVSQDVSVVEFYEKN